MSARIKHALGNAWLSACAGLFTIATAQAAPLDLSDTPLFLSTSVEPNIYFLVDDSGSMEWELMVADGTSGLPLLNNLFRYYILPSPNNGLDDNNRTFAAGCTAGARTGCYRYVVPSVSANSDTWRERNSDHNALYYNPAITYTPWPGADISGNPLYSNADPAAAPVDPNVPAGDTLNLTQDITYVNDTDTANDNGNWFIDTIYPAHYYTWSDSDSDNIVDTTDGHTLVKIESSVDSYPKADTRTDCAGETCTYNEEIQNFANWYTYYRKRSYAAKVAIGTVTNETSSARVGLKVFNNNTQATTDVVVDAASLSTSANKVTMLSSLYGLDIHCFDGDCPGTPARRALQQLGNLFEGPNTPILPQSSGGVCQQNFNVTMTDGFWNGGSPNLAPANPDDDGNTTFDGGSYGDAHENTLADVAMHYYERDLKTLLDDLVPTKPGVDDASHQHLNTYTVAFGVTGTLDPSGTLTPADASDTDPLDASFAWPDPEAGDAEKIDDLWHTAYNGRGRFLSADNPQQLAESLGDAIADINARNSSAAAVAFNSTILETGSVVYQARFNAGDWSGELLAYALDPVTGDITNTPTWNSQSQVDSQAANSRIILTYNGTSAGIPFRWTDLDPATQQADLKINPTGGTDSDTIAQARLDYLRGDRSNENAGYNFRPRLSALGDLIQSNPVFVGKPQLGYPDTAPFPSAVGQTYSEFKTTYQNRPGIVYVGANDGMLHGFSESTGDEKIAYIPHKLFSTATNAGMHYLTNPAYSHKYYVDLSPTVSDAFVSTSPTASTAWKTVLVGGLRAGGRGLFALDITNPNTFSETSPAPDNTVMWEFTNSDDSDLGYTFSKPTIAMTNAVDGSGNNRWAAIVGNGYNSDSGHAKLFILFLDGGVDGTWTPNASYTVTDYIELQTDAAIGNASDPNGLSTPGVVDLDGNGTADRVYAGDLKGNLWAFDLCNADNTGTCQNSGWGVDFSGAPLFTATDSGGLAQPITVKPVVIKHPTEANANNNQPNTLVFFGTGLYLQESDRTNTDTQSFYGVWDEGSSALARADLQAQTFDTDFTATDARVLSDNAVGYDQNGANKQYGWYIDLPTSGERVVANPKIRGQQVFFNTMIPDTTACSFGGDGWLFAVDQVDGSRPDVPVFDYNGDGVVDDADTLDHPSDGSLTDTPMAAVKFDSGIPTESNFLGENQYTSGSDGDVQKDVIDIEDDNDMGRLSWREIRP